MFQMGSRLGAKRLDTGGAAFADTAKATLSEPSKLIAASSVLPVVTTSSTNTKSVAGILEIRNGATGLEWSPPARLRVYIGATSDLITGTRFSSAKRSASTTAGSRPYCSCLVHTRGMGTIGNVGSDGERTNATRSA